MSSDLADSLRSDSPVSVVIRNGEEISGLTNMLHQFIEQTLAESPRKRRQAKKLAGEVEFRSAEDQEISVRICFAGDRIELHDGPAGSRPSTAITADFLSMAHLTAGQENPLGLLVRRKLKIRFSARQIPFLVGVLRFMQIEAPTGQSGPEQSLRARVGWGWLAAAAIAGSAAIYWLVATTF